MLVVAPSRNAIHSDPHSTHRGLREFSGSVGSSCIGDGVSSSSVSPLSKSEHLSVATETAIRLLPGNDVRTVSYT